MPDLPSISTLSLHTGSGCSRECNRFGDRHEGRAGVRPKLFGFGGDFYWIVIAAFVNVPRPNSSIFNLRETHYRYVSQNNFGLRLVGRDDRPGESGSGTR